MMKCRSFAPRLHSRKPRNGAKRKRGYPGSRRNRPTCKISTDAIPGLRNMARAILLARESKGVGFGAQIAVTNETGAKMTRVRECLKRAA